MLHHTFHAPKIPNHRPPLIFIHGAGGSFLSWHPHLRRLEGETVYTIDLPGHGNSDGMGRQSMQDYANDVWQFIAENQIQKPILIGHSMGGAIVLTLGLQHPDQITGLALFGTGAKLRVSPIIFEKAKDANTFADAVQLVNEYSFNPDAPKDLIRLSTEAMLKLNPKTLLGDFLACDSFDVTGKLNVIQVSTLILCGTLDVMTPPKFSKSLAEQIPQAQLHLLEKTGHMLMLEQPDVVAKLLKQFLDEVPLLS